MTPNPTSTFRFPEITRQQVAELCDKLGTTQVQLLILAVDRLYREEIAGKGEK